MDMVLFSVWLPLAITIIYTVLQYRMYMLMKPQSSVEEMAVPIGKWKRYWKRYWPIWIMSALVILCWAPYVGMFIAVKLMPHPINGPVYWGRRSPDSVEMQIDGRYFSHYEDTHKLVLACFHSDGSVDTRDIILHKSAMYDIEPTIVTLVLKDAALITEPHSGPTYYAVLLIPNGINTTQFSTLREAERLGARIAGIPSGPP